MSKYGIVKDSSIWMNPGDYKAVNERDPMLRLGIVKKCFLDEETNEIKYLVEVQNHNDKIELSCIMLRRFGGVYNYEDYIMRGYTINDFPDLVSSFEAKAGDAVLVGQLNGQGRQGVIIGGLTHAARETDLDPDDGPAYISEFNGVETEINSDGEYTITVKGKPINEALLKSIPTIDIPPPIYNKAVGGTYMTFDKDGGWEVNDSSLVGEQSIKIDKSGGEINIASGQTTIDIKKLPGSIEISTKKLTIDTDISVSVSTLTHEIEATLKATMKAPQVAIGTDGIELLDQIGQLIDALGSVAPISPLGPCTPLQATPMWVQVQLIKAKLKTITGSF